MEVMERELRGETSAVNQEVDNSLALVLVPKRRVRTQRSADKNDVVDSASVPTLEMSKENPPIVIESQYINLETPGMKSPVAVGSHSNSEISKSKHSVAVKSQYTAFEESGEKSPVAVSSHHTTSEASREKPSIIIQSQLTTLESCREEPRVVKKSDGANLTPSQATSAILKESQVSNVHQNGSKAISEVPVNGAEASKKSAQSLASAAQSSQLDNGAKLHEAVYAKARPNKLPKRKIHVVSSVVKGAVPAATNKNSGQDAGKQPGKTFQSDM